MLPSHQNSIGPHLVELFLKGIGCFPAYLRGMGREWEVKSSVCCELSPVLTCLCPSQPHDKPLKVDNLNVSLATHGVLAAAAAGGDIKNSSISFSQLKEVKQAAQGHGPRKWRSHFKPKLSDSEVNHVKLNTVLITFQIF